MNPITKRTIDLISELRSISELPTDQDASPDQCNAVAIAVQLFDGPSGPATQILIDEAVRHYVESIRLRNEVFFLKTIIETSKQIKDTEETNK